MSCSTDDGHRRSNVEPVFFALRRKYGETVRARTGFGQLRAMEYSDTVRYVGWTAASSLIIIGVGSANYFGEPGIVSTWITWAILIHLAFQNYRLKLAID